MVDNVYGIVSLIVWSVTIIVTLKYVLLVLRADNDGEGGILSLITLITRKAVGGSARTKMVLAALGIFGASLFFGDSMITPAISVLSAVEGLKLVEPSFSEYVVPVTAVIIVLLFASQRFGTAKVGRLFGPVMIVWFTAIGACGIGGIVRQPHVSEALSPTYALATAPLAMRANVEHNRILHEHVMILSIATQPVPYVHDDARIEIDDLGYEDDGIVHVTARYGYMESPDVPAILRLANAASPELGGGAGAGDTSYFLSTIELRVGDGPGMAAGASSCSSRPPGSRPTPPTTSTCPATAR